MTLGMLNWDNLGIGNFEFLDFRNRVMDEVRDVELGIILGNQNFEF